LELSEHKQKSGKVVSSGPQCMKTSEILFEGAEDASCREASLLATQCPSHVISKWNCSTSRVLTSWDHSISPMIASTFWSLWTTFPSGWKRYPAELQMPSMRGRCFMKSSSLVSENQGKVAKAVVCGTIC
jgi:hypothetical protein